jgi:phosphoserine phosphatase RsbU/P
MHRERATPDPAETGSDPREGVPPAVLVLDDSAAQSRMVAALLRRWGYDARACTDAAEALDLARDPRIGLIVSDWMMPGMTGPEFCRRLRATRREGYQYVILLTSRSETSDLSEGLEAGADDFLTKPVSAPELRARVNAGARIVAMQGELLEKTRSLGNALAEIRQLYAAIDADLEEARRLQRSLLRDRHRVFPGAELSLWLKASGHVGGDMVGVFRASAHAVGFYSLDVSGHGVASAMVVARAAGMLSDGAPYQNVALVSHGDGVFAPLPPDIVARRLNEQLLSELKGERYLTIALGFLDLRTGAVQIVQAGHPNPLLLRAAGGIEPLGAGGMPIGLFADARFEAFSLQLAPGDRILLYSDGLTDCPGPDGSPLDEEGLVEVCRRSAALSGKGMLAAIAQALERHRGGRDFPDDVSALLVTYTGI